MSYLVRHRLVHVRKEALARLAEAATSGHARAGLTHWVDRMLPLVVTRQHPDQAPHLLCLGLPLPLHWGRHRLGFSLPREDVLVYTSFPSLGELVQARAPALRPLADTLQALGLHTQVYGSHGWQWLSSLTYIHEASDLDLLIRVHNTHQADLAAEALLACEEGPLRLDGELMFPNGAAVAWREWAAWRAGRTPQYLIKTLHGAELVSSTAALETLAAH